MSKNKKLAVCAIVVAIMIIITVVVADIMLVSQTVKKTDYAMGAVISQEIKGKNADKTADEIISEIKKTENEISWRIETSEIAKLNENKSYSISPKIAEIFKTVLEVSRKSFGAVDPTIASLTHLWNIGDEKFKVPSEEEIKEALKNVSFEGIILENGKVSIGENQLIDFGFVGKGVACDEAKKILIDSKSDYAVINVGGNLCLHGKDDFTVGIRNPLGDVSEYMAVLTLKESFIATSGNYERVSESGGKKYHHILSTETGYPVENDLMSVTVVCNSGILSDALSTAVYCLGYDAGLDLLEEYNAEAVFVFNDKTVKVTEGLKNSIEIKNDEFKLWKEN